MVFAFFSTETQNTLICFALANKSECLKSLPSFSTEKEGGQIIFLVIEYY